MRDIQYHEIKETSFSHPPCAADGSKPKPSMPSEGLERNLSTLRAKTLVAISAHNFGTASTDLTNPKLLSQGNENSNQEPTCWQARARLYRMRYITIVLSSQVAPIASPEGGQQNDDGTAERELYIKNKSNEEHERWGGGGDVERGVVAILCRCGEA